MCRNQCAAKVAQVLANDYPEYLGLEVFNHAQLIQIIQKMQDGYPRTEFTADRRAKTSDVHRGEVGNDDGERESEALSGADKVVARVPTFATDKVAYRDSQGKEKDELNNVPDIELQAAKARMSIAFDANAIHPGSKDFIYDVQVDFGEATEACEWDEEVDDPSRAQGIA